MRPSFWPRLVKNSKVSGVVRLHVIGGVEGPGRERAPIGSRGWVAVVRIDGLPLAKLSRLPADVSWDTHKSGDGRHEVLVTVRHDASDQEVVVTGASLIVDNTAAEARLIAEEAARAAKGFSSFAATLAVPEVAKPTRVASKITASPDPLRARATALLRSGSRLYLGLADGSLAFCSPNAKTKSGTVVHLPAFTGSVRNIAVAGGRVWWVGADGRSVYAYQDASRSVSRYNVSAAPAPPTPAVMPETVPATPDASGLVTVAAETPTTPATTPKPVLPGTLGWVKRIAVLRGRVLLLGEKNLARVLHPQTGVLTDPVQVPGLLPDAFQPPAPVTPPAESTVRSEVTQTEGDGTAENKDVAAEAARLAANRDANRLQARFGLFVTGADSANAPALVSALLPAVGTDATPVTSRFVLRTWRLGSDGAWHMVGDAPTNAEPSQDSRFALACSKAAAATVTADRTGLHLARDNGDGFDLPFTLSPNMPSYTERIATANGNLWWESRGIVFRADTRANGTRDAFLPWNLGDCGGVLALAADANGAWVATGTKGVRYIRPGFPNAKDGYNGYVRARLGAETSVPPSARKRNVAGAIEAWQGIPYVWGGQSRYGMDCSGFVMRLHEVGGVSIPRTSAEMRHSGRGVRVRDELRWGDTLVYPGHCALYIGDGRTAETVGGSNGGSVSKASVWVRSNVVVRRFMP